eukprot:TRINITY_DN2034_c0_g1_i1.p1 TRINITY_DN2034_c0_g1~~TRINITY_DN2034_c0_g1_i1.p1  ORF type:complete len:358 (-),score=37.48 TRINITY_DN2034_c0_g1_i1:68-1012(-)
MGGFSSKKVKSDIPSTVSDKSNEGKPQEEQKTNPSQVKSQEELKEKLFSKKNLESAASKALVDVVFMCDCTSSMSSFIEAAKATVRKMVAEFREQYSDSSIFVGFIAYRDHGDPDILETLELTGDMEEAYKFINKLVATGGGDIPEAVADALDVAANKMQWREESLKLLIHILDAPAHGNTLHSCHDSYPKGCPCGLDPLKLLQKLGQMETQYTIMSFGDSAYKMIEAFKKHHKDLMHIKLDQEQLTEQEKVDVEKYRCAFGESAEVQAEKRMYNVSYAAADNMIAKTSTQVHQQIGTWFSKKKSKFQLFMIMH